MATHRATAAPPATEAGPSAFGLRVPTWASFALIVLVAVAAYWPALDGAQLWDDDAHVTRPQLRSLHGLYRIWFEVVGDKYPATRPDDPGWHQGATQQYYPLLHSFFWVQHRLWGDNTLGYHGMNLLLHLTAAWLVYVVLRRLQIPGGLLAAAIFALHPVQAETVAWITEQKNTLSAVFYLGAMLSYLHFDGSRRGFWYALALGLFVLGLLSKTVTATLPAALLVVFWWQRGRSSLAAGLDNPPRLSWRRDVLPLTPFFVLGAAAGLGTAWLERNVIAAAGDDFDLSFVQRGLLAGRAVWFYLGKLVWPANLMFFYPRWEIDPTDWRQWLLPVSAIAAFAILWAIHGRTRAPLAAALLFVGTLLPALGFFNVYSFRFSYVADHFQYLASIAMIALFAGTIGSTLARGSRQVQVVGATLCVLLLGVLAVLTHQQAPKYANAVTLYQTTLKQNPACWLAYNNLGAEYLKQDQVTKAIENFERELELKPDFVGGHLQLGAALVKTGREQEAIKHLERAVQLKPPLPEAHGYLGLALFKAGQGPEAFKHFHEALRLQPNSAEARSNLGKALLDSGRPLEAIAELEKSVQLRPDNTEARCNLGVALRTVGRTPEAIDQYREALRIKPTYAPAHSNLGVALLMSGQMPEAMDHFEEAVRVDPDFSKGHNNLATVLLQMGKPEQALKHLQESLRINPQNAAAWASMAAAQVQLDRIEEGIASAEKALELARAQGQTTLVRQLEAWLPLVRGEPHGPASSAPAP